MAQTNVSMPYVPGPTNVWLGSPPAGDPAGVGTYLYLGQTERGVRLSVSPLLAEVMVDGGGTMAAYDEQYMGESGSVSLDLIYYKESVLNLLKGWLNDGTAPGSGANGSIGTLVRTEGYTFQLVIQSLYGNKAVFSNNNMNSAYWVKWALPVGNWEVQLSTAVKVERVSFDMKMISNLNGGYQMYTNDISGLTLPTPT